MKCPEKREDHIMKIRNVLRKESITHWKYEISRENKPIYQRITSHIERREQRWILVYRIRQFKSSPVSCSGLQG